VPEIIVFRKAEDMSDKSKTSLVVVGFEVLMVVLMKNSVFWDITLCSLLRIDNSHLLHIGFFLGSFFDAEGGGNVFLLKTLVDFQWITWRYIPEDRLFKPYSYGRNHMACKTKVKIL
jgi:hypothetical protein